jgi:hypothetical protein
MTQQHLKWLHGINLDAYNIPIDFKVTNENDSKAMGGMLRRPKPFGTQQFYSYYDKDITLK